MIPGYSTDPFDGTYFDTDSLSAENVLKGLLQHNFFPSQKELKEDLPPSISSESFSREVAKLLIDCPDDRAKSAGYDCMEYKLTRFNGVSRLCSIPHPKPYAQLAWSIYENWGHLDYIVSNSFSRIVPKNHDDGRIIIMDYEDGLHKIDRALQDNFGMRFMARTDISNFYPSIYTHAVPWAIVGINEAKASKNNKKQWYNKFDEAIRINKRNETQGIAIGPATSNIIAETILAKVDAELSHEFTFSRYIDDYTAFCESDEQAHRFILRLSEELSKYKLVLNAGKTQIKSLPQPHIADWVIALRNALPNEESINERKVIDYLDYSVRLANESPNGSVLKYALRALIGVITRAEADWKVKGKVVQYALNLSFYRPILLPMLDPILDYEFIMNEEFFQKLTDEFIRLQYSDIISWALYYSGKFGFSIATNTADRIIQSGDCIPILFLHLVGNEQQRANVAKFAHKLNRKDPHEIDQYWLLLYQLFLDERIPSPYGKKSSFEVLRDSGTNFVVPPPSGG